MKNIICKIILLCSLTSTCLPMWRCSASRSFASRANYSSFGQKAKKLFTKEKMSAGLRRTATGLYGLSLAGILYEKKLKSWLGTQNSIEYSNSIISIQPKKSIIFIKNVLREYEFPESIIDNLVMAYGPFGTTKIPKYYLAFEKDRKMPSIKHSPGNHVLCSIINDLRIEKAQCKYKGLSCEKISTRQHKTEEKTEEDIQKEAKKRQLNPELVRYEAEIKGEYITKHTLPLWRGSILHEGGHMMHNHAQKAAIGCALSPFAAHYGFKYGIRPLNKKFQKSTLFNICKQKLGIAGVNVIKTIGRIPLLGITVSLGLLLQLAQGKYHEYQADQEVIKRVKDPEILEASAYMFEKTAKYRDAHFKDEKLGQICMKYPFLWELRDEHPRGEVRARYFKEAANALKKERSIS